MDRFIENILSGNNTPINGMVEFNSSDHIRYCNGRDVSGHNYNCNRKIRIEKNIEGGEGYTVTIFNEDGIHPFWGNNIQMAPKQMKIIQRRNNIVTMRGYGCDIMGNIFSNYGITIEFEDNEIEKCTLHLYDRSVDLKYFK